MTPTDTAREAVDDLIQAVDWLSGCLIPGSAKPYRAPQATAEKRAERAAQARLDRIVAGVGADGIVPLGESPAPLDLGVMDLLSQAMTTADRLAELVSDTAKVARMPAAPSAFTDPVPYLLHVLDLIPACRHHPDVITVITDLAAAVVEDVQAPLGLLYDGQMLPFECPWCGGRTSKHPVGGAQTLRVLLVPIVVNQTTGEVKQVPSVTCEGGQCTPPDAHVGHWHRNRPVWPLDTDGAFLSTQIEAARHRRAEATRKLTA